MESDDTPGPVLMTLAFDDVRDFQSQWHSFISRGTCFVAWPRPLFTGDAVRLHVIVVGAGTADVDATVDSNDTDSFGRNGALLKLPRPAVDDLGKLFELAVKPARPSGPTVTGGNSDVAPGATAWPTRPSPPSRQTLDGFSDAFGSEPDAITDHGELPLTQTQPDAFETAKVSTSEPRPQVPIGLTQEIPAGERLEPGTVLDNRFEIEAHIGTGGMGEVYRAQHVFLKRPIALKLLKRNLAADPEMWARFQREAEMISQLESQHIVRVFDFGRTSSGTPFLAMEFVQGTTLDRLLANESPLQPARVVELISQVCEGLAEAHGVGIVHRDLKPPNIIVGKRRDGTPIAKILDFGIARTADAQKVGGPLTQLGMVVGTPAYLAPEQALGDALDARTDVYALGCATFELLTGRPPFIEQTIQKMIGAHLKDAPPSPRSLREDLSPALSDVLLKALAKDREHRWQSARAFAAALRDAIKDASAPPGAFDDWPPAETAAPSDDPWSSDLPSEVIQGEPLPDDEATAAPPPSDAKSFFSMDTGRVPTAAKSAAPQSAAPHRLEQALTRLKIVLPDELKGRVAAARSALEAGPRKGVLLHVEVLRAPVDGGARATAFARCVTAAVAHDAVVDAIDEDGLTLLFLGEEGSAVQALYLALYLREAVADAVHGATVRAAAVAGKVPVSEKDEPLAGELPLRARTFAAKAGAGKIVADRSLATEAQDVVALGEAGHDVVEIADRKSVLTNVQTLSGRDAVLAALDKRLSALAQGVVAPVLVTGESGSGRTTIASELLVRSRHQQAVAFVARGSSFNRGQPFSALGELLCSVCGVPRELKLSKLAPALEGLKLPPAELEAALVVAGVRHVPQPFTPGQAVYGLRAVLALAATSRKVVLVFDGLESMDPYSVDAFAEMCAHPVQRELTVGFCDPAFAAERFPSIPEVKLEPLRSEEAAAMITAWLGGKRPNDHLLDTVHRRARGQPGLVIDWLHLLADRGLIRTRTGEPALATEPEGLDDHDLASARVRALWPDAQRLFETTCLAGDSIEGTVLNAVLPQTPQPAYQRLVGSRLLRALGGRRWAVASDRYASACLELPSQRRPELHAKLAAVLIEAARAGGAPPDAARIAEHLTQGKDAARAVQLWRSVTEGALKRRSPRDVLQGLRGWADALGLMSGAQATPEVTRARLDTLARAAANAVACQEPLLARALVDEALSVAAEQKVESAELQLSVARVLRSEARRARAAEALEVALERARDSAVLQLVWAERGEALEAEGDLSGACAAFKQALTNADAAQDVGRWHGEIDFRARIETRLAGVLVAQKDVAQAKVIYANALAAWHRTAYPYAEARVLANLGALHAQSKDAEAAARCFKDAAAAAARSGDLYFQARQLLNLAKVTKRFDANVAKQAADAARRSAQLIGWEEGKAQAAAVLA